MNARELEQRSDLFSERCMKLADALPKRPSAKALAAQLARSAPSVAANYRAATRARSHAEFIAKLSIVVEECDETVLWLNKIGASKLIRPARLDSLQQEGAELLAIFAKSRRTAQTRAATKARAPRIKQSTNSIAQSPNRSITLSGIGYDVHRFATGRPLILGGVEIPHSHGLDGHSDADVLAHAIADAVLGAIGERDIGFHFPNSDASIRGISSLEILRKAAALATGQGGRVLNIDATLIAEAPKIMPHVAAMRANLAAALGLPVARVGVKATTNERMGFIGRDEGIAALAVASVELPEPAETA
jgi:2-C-methyl-D-erythritol 2,4-cyclodiphosphate synthase